MMLLVGVTVLDAAILFVGEVDDEMVTLGVRLVVMVIDGLIVIVGRTLPVVEVVGEREDVAVTLRVPETVAEDVLVPVATTLELAVTDGVGLALPVWLIERVGDDVVDTDEVILGD